MLLTKIMRKPNGAAHLKRFLKNTSGSLTPMFGLAAIPFFLAAGMAIDMARATREQTAFYSAVDGAALAIAADDRSALETIQDPDAKEQRRALLEKYAEDYLEQNYRDVSGGGAKVDAKLKIDGQKIDLTAKLEFPMTIMRLAGVDTMSLGASSTIQKAMKPIELAMVLDTTGSMKNDMTALKTSANKLLATLYGDPSPSSKNMRSEYIRVSLVPFSGAVRLNPSAYDFSLDWIDTTGTNPLSKINFSNSTWHNYMAWSKLKKNSTTPLTWNGCVEARKWGSGTANYITTDVEPASSDIHSKFPAYFNPDSPSFYTVSSGNDKRYPTNTSGSTATGSWNNNYITARLNYASTGSSDSRLLAPSGSWKTGSDDSTIGNVNTGSVGENGTVLQLRFKNVAKYDGFVIGDETPTLAADQVTWSVKAGPWSNCTGSAVVPMTYDRAKVEAGITSMKAMGGTNIAEGLAWGMRVLSPTEPFTKVEGSGSIPASTIAPYNGPRWQKILVLMTDGQNDPYSRWQKQDGTPDLSDNGRVNFVDTGTGYNALGFTKTPTTGNLNRYGSTSFDAADNTLDSYSEAICTKLKAEGVTIYTVAYKTTGSLMSNCATSPAHYKYASDAVELAAFFDHIGKDVLNKMVYVSK